MYATASSSFFSLFQETRSSVLSIFCIFPHFTQTIHTHTHFYLREQDWNRTTEESLNRRSTITDQIVSACISTFLSAIKLQQLSSHFSATIKSFITTKVFICLFSHLRHRKRERRERKKGAISYSFPSNSLSPLSLSLSLSLNVLYYTFSLIHTSDQC